MIRDRFGDVTKVSIELHPSRRRRSGTGRRELISGTDWSRSQPDCGGVLVARGGVGDMITSGRFEM